jgi:hypothetical protein
MNKQQLIDNHRYINVEHSDWYDHVYDDFKCKMTGIGIFVHRIYFSGFSSQGDGACFEGRVGDWGLFLPSIGYTDPVLLEHAVDNWVLSVHHHGNYCHENCTWFDTTLPIPDEYSTGEEFMETYSPYTDEFRSKAWLAVIDQYRKHDFEDDCITAFKEHMRDVYHQLEEAHDYLTSDEAVWDTLEANDMTDELEEIV